MKILNIYRHELFISCLVLAYDYDIWRQIETILGRSWPINIRYSFVLHSLRIIIKILLTKIKPSSMYGFDFALGLDRDDCKACSE